MVKKKGKKASSKKAKPSQSKSSVVSELRSIRRLLSQVHSKQRIEERILKSNEERMEESFMLPSIKNASEVDELEEIKELEKNLKKDLQPSPLKRITYRDITKGIVGSSFVVIGDFSFVAGAHVAETHSFLRSTGLFVLSFFIIITFIYFAGFRKVNDKFVFQFLPIRAIVLYISSILTTLLILWVYGVIPPGSTFTMIYSTVASISVLAVLGAGTADLIGKE